MKLYNKTTDRVENIKTIKTPTAEMYVTALTEAERNELGYFDIVSTSPQDRRYYVNTPNNQLIGNKYTLGYMSVEKDVASVQGLMNEDLFVAGQKYEDDAVVDTGLGYKIKGNAQALNAFSIGSKRGVTTIRDVDYVSRDVSVSEIAKMVADIEYNGMSLFSTKGTKFDEIQLFTTVDECINYEHEPYDYTITAEDVANDHEGNLVEGDVIVRYRNNVTDWQI